VTEEVDHVLMPTPTASLETNTEEPKINASLANNAVSMKLPTPRELDVLQDHWLLVDVPAGDLQMDTHAKHAQLAKFKMN
jgi:hypothetical protein